MWFIRWVVATSRKYSTTRAGQPVTSRASCSSTEAVPRRRRIADGVGDLGPGAGDAGGRAVQRPVADQAADVGRRPVGAGLDELVVVELLDVLLDDGRLLGDHAEQLAQREALVGVAEPVDRRQQGVEALGGHPHGITCRSRGAGRG